MFALLDRLVIAALTPGVPFDPAAVPPPPDYDEPAHWSALPGRIDADDVEVATLATIDPERALVDVFYVHPTSYLGDGWNARVGDAVVDDAADRGGARIHASAFHSVAAVHAPRYRQANPTAFTDPSDDGARALAVAGDDVIAAFRHYLARAGGRPFILAGHSQGAAHGFRLLREVVIAEGLQDRLVVAYLIGGPINEADVAAVPGLRVCDAPDETGCLVAWHARSASYTGGLDFVAPAAGAGATASPRVCVNPLTWRHDDGVGERSRHRGAVFFAGDAAPELRSGFTDARCRGGTLIVALAGDVPREPMSWVLDLVLGDGNYHPIEFNLFYVDLREDAARRVQRYLATKRSAGGGRDDGMTG